MSDAEFTIIPNAILRDATLSIHAKFVYAEVLTYAWTPRGCTREQRGLAEDLGIGVSTVQRALRELEARDLITVEVNGRGNAYRPKLGS